MSYSVDDMTIMKIDYPKVRSSNAASKVDHFSYPWPIPFC